jgi:hypothetical protein
MIEILCINSNCRTTFKFHEGKNPHAKSVMCPKCRGIQPLNIAKKETVPPPIEVQNDEEEEWWNPKQKSPDLPIHIVQTPLASPKKQVEKNIDEDEFTPPIVKHEPNIPVNTPKNGHKRTPNNPDFGWLVVHDEYTKTRTYLLQEGINRIGRHSDDGMENRNISIVTEDTYMSRYHCDIEVRRHPRTQKIEYLITDKAYGPKKQSTNGTYINASRRRLTNTEEMALQDGDTVQVGATKLVLKTPEIVKNAIEAEEIVKQTDYLNTVIF